MGIRPLELIHAELSPIHLVLKAPLAVIRETYNRMLDEFPIAPGVKFSEVEFEGIKAQYGRTEGEIPGRALLLLHGGGYMIGCAKSYRALGSELASRLKASVLIPDYRLAPEHPYPAALQDAARAYRWLLAQGCPARTIAIVGDSAGGGLTLCLLQALREVGTPMPSGAALMSPWTDLELTGASMTSKAAVDQMLTPEALAHMAQAYLVDTPVRLPTASPLHGDLREMPPLLIQVGSEEILLDDSVRVAGVAGAAGTDIHLRIWPGMFHIFQVFSSRLEQAREALDEMAAFLAPKIQK